MSTGPQHGERDHALWAPSSIARMIACPHSVDDPGTPLPKNAPEFWATTVPEDLGSFAAARGTRMHEKADEYITHYKETKAFDFDERLLAFTNPEDGEECTIPPEEWHRHVLPFVEGVINIYEEACLLYGDDQVELLNEVTVNVWGSEIWGSVDAAIVTPETLDIIDLKCGHGLVAASSAQNKTYACGLLSRIKKQARIRLHISQAENHAANGWDTYECPIEELREHLSVITKIPAASRNAKAAGEVPGPENINDHCNFCPKLTVCPAHRERAVNALALADKPAEVIDLPVNKLRDLVAMGPQLRALIAAAEKQLQALTEAGEETGYKMVHGKSTRKWNPDLFEEEIANELYSLANMIGVKLEVFDRKLKSFTAAEKVLGKGNIDHLIVKPEGKPTMVPLDDKRPAIDMTKLLDDSAE